MNGMPFGTQFAVGSSVNGSNAARAAAALGVNGGSSPQNAGGLVAFGATRDLDRVDEEAGVTELVRLRGFDARALELARTVAIALRVVRVVGLPGLVFSLATLAVAASPSAALSGPLRSAGVVFYSLCFGAGIAFLCRAAVLLAPARGRLVLLALVFGPELGAVLVPGLPSVPRLYSRLLDLCLGGALS